VQEYTVKAVACSSSGKSSDVQTTTYTVEASQYSVTFTISLDTTVDAFTESMQASFKEAIAEVLGIDSSRIALTFTSTRRRRLLALSVAVTVTTASASDSSFLSSQVSGSASSINSQIQSATGVTATTDTSSISSSAPATPTPTPTSTSAPDTTTSTAAPAVPDDPGNRNTVLIAVLSSVGAVVFLIVAAVAMWYQPQVRQVLMPASQKKADSKTKSAERSLVSPVQVPGLELQDESLSLSAPLAPVPGYSMPQVPQPAGPTTGMRQSSIRSASSEGDRPDVDLEPSPFNTQRGAGVGSQLPAPEFVPVRIRSESSESLTSNLVFSNALSPTPIGVSWGETPGDRAAADLSPATDELLGPIAVGRTDSSVSSSAARNMLDLEQTLLGTSGRQGREQSSPGVFSSAAGALTPLPTSTGTRSDASQPHQAPVLPPLPWLAKGAVTPQMKSEAAKGGIREGARAVGGKERRAKDRQSKAPILDLQPIDLPEFHEIQPVETRTPIPQAIPAPLVAPKDQSAENLQGSISARDAKSGKIATLKPTPSLIFREYAEMPHSTEVAQKAKKPTLPPLPVKLVPFEGASRPESSSTMGAISPVAESEPIFDEL